MSGTKYRRRLRLRTAVAVGALASGLVVGAAGVGSAAPTDARGAAGAGPTGQVITDIATDKSRYSPGETVRVTIGVTNKTGRPIRSGAVTLNFTALQQAAGRPVRQPLSLSEGASRTLTFTWKAPRADYTGYLARAVATDASGGPLDSANVAVDVSSSWARFPRYGYMTNNSFGKSDLSPAQAASVMKTMSSYHIDGLQFYDWQYNHDQPLCGTVSAPCSSWIDDGNQRTVYASAVKDLVGAAHNKNIVAMPYNAIFSADNGWCCGAPDYHTQGLGISPTWGIYQDTSHTTPLSFFQWDYMDPSNPDWQRFLMKQEMAAIQAFGFDGYHGDTFGDPDTIDYRYDGQPAGVASNSCTTDTETANSSTPVHNVAGSPTWISGTFPSFLKYAKSVLGRKYLMFNPVSYDHAHCEANTSAADLLYTELWPNDQDQYWDYNTLKKAVDQGFDESASASPTGRGKSLAVAAYVDYTNGGGGSFDTPDVLLMDSALFASGGSHEELGDSGQMLDYQEYRAGATPMSASLSRSVQSYYDFMTAYENLLRDRQTNTAQAVSIDGQAVSRNAAPNSVWAFTKADASHEIIQFINLVGQSSTLWQTGKCDGCSHITSPHPAPTQLTNAHVKYYYRHRPKAVMFASPDVNDGTTYRVPFTTGADAKGSYVSFTLPRLNYWDMVYLSQTGPGDAPTLP
ncbi:MAG TPA: glycoside hydrolase family 66 protein [Mycobacteriales bacterium]